MIAFHGVKKIFGGHEILYEDIIFENDRSYLILGASGSGKTTLLNMIAGVTNASAGTILMDGIDLVKQPQAKKDTIRTHKIGYIYQDFKLIEDMTAEDNIRILEICGIRTHDLQAVAEDLGIADKLRRKVKNLSGGEKQRVAIARALVKRPQIILADEPTGSLPYEIGDSIVQKLMECSKGRLNITVSHDTRLIPYFDTVIDLTRKEDGAHA